MSSVTIDYVNYSLSGTTATITGNSSPPSNWNLVIPSTITNGGITDNVTSIGNFAFQNCDNIISVIIPNSVTSIGEHAFEVIDNLTNINMPSSVTSIGDYAFSSCTNLRNIVINSFISNLGAGFFGLNNTNSSWTFNYGAIPVGACNGRTNVTSVTIGSAITGIGNFAFKNCDNIISVIIPNSVTSIGEHAFEAIDNLTSINIPASVTSIGDYAFSGCTNLRNIVINSFISSLGVGFFGLNNTNSSWTFNYAGAIPVGACNGRTNVKSVTIGSGITSIGESAFQSCSGLTSINIPASVTSIGSSAFRSCSGLTSITIPSSVTSIGSSAFQSCSGLTSINIPSSVTSIGASAFQSCSGLTSINIPASVTSIGSSAFRSCSGLTSITIPSSVTSIGSSAFQSCSGLTSINIPSSVTSIGASAFDGCSPSLVVNYNPTINDLPSDVTWYSFNIKLNSNNSTLFEGYFVVINSTNFIKLMYLKNNLITNILAPYTNNDYGYNGIYNAGSGFDGAGTNIINISALNSLHNNASTWNFWENYISYKDATTGIWTDLPSNTVTYSFAQLTSSPISPVIPICFPAGTPVVTDQGSIAIEKINPDKNTIRGKKIVAITKTITLEDKIVRIEKDALAPSVPSQTTFISRNHKLLFNKQMVKAKSLIGKVDGVYNKKYNGEILYNVLLETHEKMLVNNLIVETLDPTNIVAQLYNGSHSVKERNQIIININQCASDYKKIYGKLR